MTPRSAPPPRSSRTLMTPPVPTADGQVNLYNLSNSAARLPRVYYVNGIQTTPGGHAGTASFLSLPLERPRLGRLQLHRGQEPARRSGRPRPVRARLHRERRSPAPLAQEPEQAADGQRG